MQAAALAQTAPANNDESKNSSANTKPPPAQNVKLFGRIEQLVNRKGAALPKQLLKMVPVLDQSRPTEDEAPMPGKTVKSFPKDWEGIWKGNVTVTNRENTDICWLSQPAATYRACQFFKPGATLSLICRFHRENGELTLSPPVARAQLKHAEDLVKAILLEDTYRGGTKLSLPPPDLSKAVPIEHIESFSFGKRYGPSLGGNFVDNEVLSNQLRELSAGVIEQDLLTSGTTHSLYGAAEAVSSMGETVIRLTRKEGKLAVNLAYVNYQSDGMWVSKCVLEGSLERVGD